MTVLTWVSGLLPSRNSLDKKSIPAKTSDSSLVPPEKDEWVVVNQHGDEEDMFQLVNTLVPEDISEEDEEGEQIIATLAKTNSSRRSDLGKSVKSKKKKRRSSESKSLWQPVLLQSKDQVEKLRLLAQRKVL